MHEQKSYAELVLGTLTAMLKDAADMYPECAKEFERDEKRLSSAVEHHGIEFVLVTMAAFRKHFDKCLSEERLTLSRLNHFGPSWKGSPIPRLFRGLMMRVFDRSGIKRVDADVHSIRIIRNLLGGLRKLRVDCGLKNTREAVREFFRTDAEVSSPSPFWEQGAGESLNPDSSVSFLDYARNRNDGLPLFDASVPPPIAVSPALLDTVQRVADLFAGLLGEFFPLDWKARHGPGAISDARYGAYKYAFPSWSDRLDAIFPFSDFGCANYQDWADRISVESLPSSQDFPAKLAAVPKTRTTPRLIAVEPTANQWCQQVIRDYFYTRVPRSPLRHFISFDDQEKNGELALKASRDQSHATIDLSSASDRISCGHVERLFRRSPGLLHALRSSRAVWLRQDICRVSPGSYRLRKYSTMGNATTFPVQSLFFLTLASACCFFNSGRKVSQENLLWLARCQVRVFGDDIIVPNSCSGLLVELLHHLGLKVNAAKTFEHGMFKESCGVDAYGGQDVTSVNIMDVPRRAKPGSVVSTVDVVNNLISRGFYHTALWIRRFAERQGITKVPDVKHGSGSFGWQPNPYCPPSRLRTRWCNKTYRLLTYALSYESKQARSTAVEGYGLLQYFTEAPKHVTSAVSTLGYATRRPQVSLRLRWASLDV